MQVGVRNQQAEVHVNDCCRFLPQLVEHVIIVIYLSFVKIEILYFPNLLVSFKVRCLDLACFFNFFVLWLFVFGRGTG